MADDVKEVPPPPTNTNELYRSVGRIEGLLKELSEDSKAQEKRIRILEQMAAKLTGIAIVVSALGSYISSRVFK